ncbi:MAG: hypothetical protein R3Y11_12910, partial [Pseudomonadota bacterium]
ALQSTWITGFFLCLQAYPALYAIVGTSLPNYKGMFLRGYGSRTNYQQNGTENGYSTTTHASGSLGAVQGDAIRNIEGYYTQSSNASHQMFAEPVTASGAYYQSSYETTYYASESSKYYGSMPNEIGIDASRVVPTATENRPVNIAVNYLIKAY